MCNLKGEYNLNGKIYLKIENKISSNFNSIKTPIVSNSPKGGFSRSFFYKFCVNRCLADDKTITKPRVTGTINRLQAL